MGPRKEAAWSLGKIGSSRAVEPLSQVSLKDKDKNVQKVAKSALENILAKKILMSP